MPAPPWTAEHAVTEEMARSLIESQFPQFAPTSLRLLGVGWDNTALLVNDRYVFRFPRRSVVVQLLETEVRVLRAIAPLVPLPIPVPIFVGHPDRDYAWTFAGYERLEGHTACSAALSDGARVQMARPLAEFLRALHSIGPHQAHWVGAPRDIWNRFDLERKTSHTRARLAELTEAGVLQDASPYLALVEDAFTTRAGKPMALTHGDLYVRHLLVDDASRLCGVIDWGDVHIGDIAVDLAIVCGFLPPEGREVFRSVYPQVDSETWRLARFHALYHACITARYGHEIGDADLTREGLFVLRNVLA